MQDGEMTLVLLGAEGFAGVYFCGAAAGDVAG